MLEVQTYIQEEDPECDSPQTLAEFRPLRLRTRLASIMLPPWVIRSQNITDDRNGLLVRQLTDDGAIQSVMQENSKHRSSISSAIHLRLDICDNAGYMTQWDCNNTVHI